MGAASQLVDLLLICFFLLSMHTPAAGVADKRAKGQNLTDGETLVSANGSFTLGFFSPGGSTKRYLGIWFSVSNSTVCWVANRNQPLGDTSGMLLFNDVGTLVLLDGSRQTAWSSSCVHASSPAVQLLESGNLVVRNGSSNAFLWQSFDYPSDTLLPSMKLGKSLWTGFEWSITSWRSADDPSPGDYRRALDTNGLEIVLWQGNDKIYRTGPWNGLFFNGVPEASSYRDEFPLRVTNSPWEKTYGYTAKPTARLTRVVVNYSGTVERLVWDASSRAWNSFFKGPRDTCDNYATCGEFGLCNADTPSTSFCTCVVGFSPASLSEYSNKNYAGGCRRNVALDCGNGRMTTDGFKVVGGVKLPDTHNASVDMDVNLDLEECKARCFSNCSCLAYAAADIRGGGCVLWTDAIVDLRSVDSGQDLYLRLSKSEFDEAPHRRPRPFPTAPVIGAASVVVLLLVVCLSVIVIRKRRQVPDDHQSLLNPPTSVPAVDLPTIQAATENLSESNIIGRGVIIDGHESRPYPPTSVPAVDLPTIQAATENFSESNIIGRGGFGDVYQVQLPDGRKVAVKRLKQSCLTNKGKEDFTREVQVMSKLKHPALVEFLCHCQEGDEWILVYEYLQNKSLDLYIFGEDTRLRSSLNWEQRLEIIRGIAVGVAYLHDKQVIHRDLKPPNILLDDTWKPKIADFGTAKLFIDEQTNPTIVLSPGYTSPEYVEQRHLTLKCDVYSFGVVLLEIVSGKKRCTVKNLLPDVWKSWLQHEIGELLDSEVDPPESELLLELERCIQIGLLCVQLSPEDRPAMPEVVAMLSNSGSQLAMPKNPTVNGGAGPSQT